MLPLLQLEFWKKLAGEFLNIPFTPSGLPFLVIGSIVIGEAVNYWLLRKAGRPTPFWELFLFSLLFPVGSGMVLSVIWAAIALIIWLTPYLLPISWFGLIMALFFSFLQKKMHKT